MEERKCPSFFILKILKYLLFRVLFQLGLRVKRKKGLEKTREKENAFGGGEEEEEEERSLSRTTIIIIPE